MDDTILEEEALMVDGTLVTYVCYFCHRYFSTAEKLVRHKNVDCQSNPRSKRNIYGAARFEPVHVNEITDADSAYVTHVDKDPLA